MHWQNQWGGRIKQLEAMQQSGQQVDALLHRPILEPEDQVYWNAFHDITGSRQWTQAGPTSVPYQTIILWLDENMVDDPDDRAEYLRILQELDGAYLEYQYSKLRTK